MKNEMEIKTDVWKALRDSPLANNVNGKLSKTLRPDKSDNEDIVISVLSEIPVSQMQEVFLNINVYVADIKRGDQYEENTARLNELCKVSFESLLLIIGNGFRLSLASQKVFGVNGRNEHFINNKVLYQFCNE